MIGWQRRRCNCRVYNNGRRFLDAVVRISIETHSSRASQASRNYSAVVASIVPLKTIGRNAVVVRVFWKAVDGDLIYFRTWFFRQAPNLDASMFVALTVRRAEHVATCSAPAAAGRVSESLNAWTQWCELALKHIRRVQARPPGITLQLLHPSYH